MSGLARQSSHQSGRRRTGIARALRARAGRLAWGALAMLGIRRHVRVDGVIYRERSNVPLQTALASPDRAYKEYDVRFPSGDRMRIRATPSRRYPDLTGPRMPEEITLIESLARPGTRVLELGCGRGHTAAWLGVCVGPSGGVVALDPDNESIRYARRRHPAPNIAFEVGTLRNVMGELDGSFDGVVCSLAPEEAPAGDREPLAAELWRLTRVGGWMLVPRRLAVEIRRRSESEPGPTATQQPTPLTHLVLIHKMPGSAG